MIGVISYGAGNVGSVVNIIKKVGGQVGVVTSPEHILNYEAIVLPGVGAFDNAMQKLDNNGWLQPLHVYAVDEKKPLLGICLGMQLLTRGSEEGDREGLGYVEAETVRFDITKMVNKQRIPHMGWNVIKIARKNIFFNSSEQDERFYFVHSYHVVCDNQKDVLTTTDYGYDFVSSFFKDNIIGVQFHPEKSHRFGYAFFKKFIRYIE